MTHSSFELAPEIRRCNLARAYMWSYDGREFDAPTGFSWVWLPLEACTRLLEDLAKFMSDAIPWSSSQPDGQILLAETLEQMSTSAIRVQRGGPYGIGDWIHDIATSTEATCGGPWGRDIRIRHPADQCSPMRDLVQ